MIVASEAEEAWWPPTFRPSSLVAQVVGVVDRPGREPQHLALELGEEGQAGIWRHEAGFAGAWTATARPRADASAIALREARDAGVRG